MPETISMIPKSYEKSAILGGVGSPEKKVSIASKIDDVANKVNEILKIDPIDDLAKNKIYNKAGDLVDGLKVGASDVEEMNSVLVDQSKTDKQKEIMTTNLEILAKGTFIAMQYGGNQEMVDLLGRGSATEIDNALPKPLSGLGERILTNVFSNEQVLGVLKELDQKALEDGWKLMPPTREEKRAVLETYARNLARLDSAIPEGHPERNELEMALSYIQTELLDLREGTNTLKKETIDKIEVDDEGGTREISTNPEKQLALARSLLDVLEDRGQKPGDIDAARTIEALDLLFLDPKVNKKVKLEIDSRKRLRFIAAVMGAANGTMSEQARNSVDTALAEMDATSLHLTTEHLRFFFQGKDGLSKSTAKAWDEFQNINIGRGKDIVNPDGSITKVGSYHDILVEINNDADFCKKNGIDKWPNSRRVAFLNAGTNPALGKNGYWEDEYDNYFTDSNMERRRLVNAFLAKKIKRELKVTEYEATRGVSLAWDLVRGTQEEVIFNVALAGHHDLTELLLTKDNTLDLMSKGKSVGPLTSMDKIVSVAPTWLRFLSNRTVFGKLYSKDINVDNADNPKSDEVYWYSAIVKRKILLVVNAMRNEQPKPDEINSGTLKSLGEQMGKLAKYPSVILDENNEPIMSDSTFIEEGRDPNLPPQLERDEKGRPLIGVKEGDKKTAEKRAERLRFLYVAGIAQLAKNRLELGWNGFAWRILKPMLLAGYHMDEDDPTKISQFISESNLDKIEKTILGKRLNYDAYYLSQNAQKMAAMKEGVKTFGIGNRNRDEKFDM